MQNWHYNKSDLIRAFQDVGIEKGDTINVQVSLGRLGFPQEGPKIDIASLLLIQTLREAIGEQGTILVPVYTYSIGKGEIFDVQNTPSAIGEFTEMFRKMPGVTRSADPMLSTAGIGPMAESLLKDISRSCYGKGSLFHKMRAAGAKICTVGVGLNYATFRHHIEESAEVPFRFKKLFSGFVKEKGETRYETWEYFAAILQDNCSPDGSRLEKMARDEGLVSIASVGRGEVLCIEAQSYFEYGFKHMKKDPWLTAKGPSCSVQELIRREDERVTSHKAEIRIPETASMFQITEILSQLRRDIVSEGYDVALDAVARILSIKIHEYCTGEECWTWIIPEKWTCNGVFIKTIDGKEPDYGVGSFLNVVPYSQPYKGIVTRDELSKHLYNSLVSFQSNPYDSLIFARDWAIWCSEDLKSKLLDDTYQISIDTSFSYGSLKIGEVLAKGKRDDNIVFCCHLDNSFWVNDGLAGVAVLLEVFEELCKRSDLNFSYRLLVIPAFYGPIAFLSHNEHLINRMIGGICVEALCDDGDISLSLSKRGDTQFDKCCLLAMREFEPLFMNLDTGDLTLNDARIFNSYAVNVPMVSISAIPAKKDSCIPKTDSDSNGDISRITAQTQMEKARHFILKVIEIWEKNYIPIPLYKGYPCLHKFLSYHPLDDREKEVAVTLKIISLINGENSLVEIAALSKEPINKVIEIMNLLLLNNLIKKKE
ncbi:MAG: DUF4910 domain-containing protein [Candidatus Eremiobacteraeota bacterium]|nr:DUF4910 domain-containing protein [Candidatus Eremiobacteraeota bacterium]